MPKEPLATIYLGCIERYAAIFPEETAKGYAASWWIWAGRTLNRQLYEEVRKARWEKAGRIERLTAKMNVPGS